MEEPNPAPRPTSPEPGKKLVVEVKDQVPKARPPSPESYTRFMLDRHRHTS
jgi:hypothetical protein